MSKATGVLTLVHGGVRKSVFARGGRVVFASSNLPNDRLGEILLREGKITVEEYELSIKAISKGKRQGKALVEMGALTPKALWRAFSSRCARSSTRCSPGRTAASSSRNRTRRIRSGSRRHRHRRADLVGLRRVDANGPIQQHYPEGHLVLEAAVAEPPEGLEPYEEHVLRLVDGERSVVEICATAR